MTACWAMPSWLLGVAIAAPFIYPLWRLGELYAVRHVRRALRRRRPLDPKVIDEACRRSSESTISRVRELVARGRL